MSRMAADKGIEVLLWIHTTDWSFFPGSREENSLSSPDVRLPKSLKRVALSLLSFREGGAHEN
jgi:hypothetical protein